MTDLRRPRRRVLFHRTWRTPAGGSSGGHLKVRDAFEHFRHSPDFEPRVWFGPDTLWNEHPGNVWLPLRDEALPEWRIRPDDVLLLSGRDWLALTPREREAPPVPVLNIAHPRHASPGDDRGAFLDHPAIRIVKSRAGRAILESRGVNGPTFLVPDAIDLRVMPPPNPAPDLDVVIAGLKRPRMALALRDAMATDPRFRGMRVEVQVPPKLPTRLDFLRLLNRARVNVFLPVEEARGAEGFYLPALEGMALDRLVVCPYAVGNADFCIPEVTCSVPRYDERSILTAVAEALAMSEDVRRRRISAARDVVANHTIDKERAALLDLLHRADDIWRQDECFRRPPHGPARPVATVAGTP